MKYFYGHSLPIADPSIAVQFSVTGEIMGTKYCLNNLGSLPRSSVDKLGPNIQGIS